VRLVLQSSDTAALQTALHNRLESAGDFFEGEPVVIDALVLEQAPDWKAIARTLQDHRMPLVGVAAGESLHNSVRQCGLAVVRLPAARDAGTAPGGSIHRDPPSDDLPNTSSNAATAKVTPTAGTGVEPNMDTPAIATDA